VPGFGLYELLLDGLDLPAESSISTWFT